MTLHRSLLTLALLAALPPLAHAERGLQPKDLATLDRYSAPTLSPDGSRLVFGKRVVDFDANKSSTALWSQDVAGAAPGKGTRLTPEGWNVNSPAFAPDGSRVYFLSSKSGSQQLYAIPAGGGEPVQVTDIPGDIGSYRLSPDGKRLAFSADVFPDCGADFNCSMAKLKAREDDKASGVLYDRLFIRHWDTWADGRLSRVFTAPLGGAAPVTSATLVGKDVVGDVPSKPFGDTSEYAWSPDGRSLVLSARKADREEPWSTNFDLFLVKADGSGGARNLTAANKAWDTGPVFSHDGRTLYYRAMKRPGFEADRFALMAMDLSSGRTRELDPAWDASANGITLSADGKTIYTTAQDTGQDPLFAVSVATGEVNKLVADGTVSAFDIAGDTLAYSRNSLQTGDQLFVAALDAKNPRPVTPSAAEMLPEVRFGEAEQFTFAGWNGDTVHGYVVKPWNYQAGKQYPVAFLIHGGPQGSFGNGWSYRWNPQTYAGQGYAVVMIDFHGSTGYGQAFTDAISQHWGDRPLEDLQKGWAAAQQQYPFLDGSRACALGASYGGFMVNWIAGNWNAPWKCLVSHDGVFENNAMGYATEELWFSEWENGGTPFANAKGYQAFNPANHVDQFRVPMLVIHGQQDFRIPVEQGIALFTALQRKGVPSQFLYFPDENHWVLKPQNSVLWHRTVNDWLARYIGSGTAK